MLRQQLQALVRRTARAAIDTQKRGIATEDSRPIAWVVLGPPVRTLQGWGVRLGSACAVWQPCNPTAPSP